MRALCLLLAIAFAAPCEAQQVFKCTRPDGTLEFSQQPCGAQAEELTIRAHEPNAADRLQAGARLRPSAVSLDGDFRLCVERERRAVAGINSSIGANQRRIAQLEYRARFANNNLAGATYEAGLRQEIASLHEANATLRATAEESFARGEERCRNEREQRAQALAEAEEVDRERSASLTRKPAEPPVD